MSAPSLRQAAGLALLAALAIALPFAFEPRGYGIRILCLALLFAAMAQAWNIVAGLANLLQGPDASGAWPRNTLHLTADLCDAEFAQELTAERLVDPDEPVGGNAKKKRLVSPRAGREWRKLVNRKNDWFDATVYAFALAWHLEHKRRLNADRWNDLILELHGGDPDDVDLFGAADTGPLAPQTSRISAAEREARKQKWANRT